MQQQGTMGVDENTTLLWSIAEQLKIPLTAIARQAELSELTGYYQAVDAQAIHTHATAALALVESYLLGLHLLQGQTTLALEPVSISSTLVDIAHELSRFARQYDTTLELVIDGKYAPVMAHRTGLRAALVAIIHGLLEGRPMSGGRLTLAVHRTPRGLVTGIYGDYDQLRTGDWRQALEMHGRAFQPFAAVSSGTGAGFFVADTILGAMEARLRVGKYRKQYGIATTLQQSQQLQFV